MWTWNARRRPLDDIDALIDQADRCLDHWDVIATHEVTTRQHDTDIIRPAGQHKHRLAVTNKPTEGYAVATVVNQRWAKHIRNWELHGRVATEEFEIGTDATTNQRTRIRAKCAHIPSMINHDAAEVDFWWDKITTLQGGKRCINIILADVNCELRNDDEDHFHDAGGCIGNALRRQRDHSDDDHDHDTTHHTRHEHRERTTTYDEDPHPRHEHGRVQRT